MINNVSQSSDPFMFSGCIMLCLRNTGEDWYSLVYDISNENKEYLKQSEYECHVTIGYGYHRDDIANLQNRTLRLPMSLLYVHTEQDLSYFENPTETVAKYRVKKDNTDFMYLQQLQEQSFMYCRYINLKHPVYNPHITVGYFKTGCKPVRKLKSTLFLPTYIKTSYRDENGNLHTTIL